MYERKGKISMEIMEILLITYACWNIISFGAVGIDKVKAKMRAYRISEMVLLFMAVFMGAMGIIIGMVVFHHKVSKTIFRIVVPISVLVNMMIGYIFMK